MKNERGLDLLRENLGIVTLFSLYLLFWALTFSPALSEIAFALALVSFLIHKVLNRSKWIPHDISLWHLFLMGYVLLCVFSYFWSEYPQESFRGVFKVAQQIALFWMVGEVCSREEHLKWFEWVFLAIIWIVIINGTYQFFFGQDLLRQFPLQASGAGPRVSASFKTYGCLGAFLVTTIPFTLMFSLRPFQKSLKEIPKLRYLAFAAAIAMAILTFFTRSRGAIVSLFIAFFFLMLLLRQWRILVLLLVLSAAGIALLPRSMVIHLDAEGKEQSLVERYYLWERAAQVIKARPLSGTGINTYTKAHQKYDKTGNWRVRDYYVHNGYLQMAAETGVPSLLLFLLFLGSFLKEVLFAPPGRDGPYLRYGIAAGCLGFLAMAFIDTVMHNNQPVLNFWYFMGLAWAYTKADTARHLSRSTS